MVLLHHINVYLNINYRIYAKEGTIPDVLTTLTPAAITSSLPSSQSTGQDEPVGNEILVFVHPSSLRPGVFRFGSSQPGWSRVEATSA